MKETIRKAITNFDLINFYESSLKFFNAIGYDSDKKVQLETPNFDNFIDQFRIDEENINKEKALVSHWKEIQFLFQISNDDITRSDQLSLFHSNDVDKDYLKSYLFISIALKNENYTKTNLVNITRQINKQFLQPVLILFYYNEMLCLSVIDRRLNKKDADKDVLEKVTLIKDIRIDKPHRAHIEILNDIHLSNLNVNNFDELHKAFKTILNTKELNKRFYIELSNWYFRAKNVCEFPNEIGEKNIIEISLIRFISRILFAWFLKEKGLIPESIFTQKFYDEEINHTQESTSSRYYKAVLQNLFFATLNSKLPDRSFQEESKGSWNKQYMVFNKYRYKDYLKNPDNFLDFFKKVPFLNGGLFDCLDYEDETKTKNKRVYVDCFTNNKNNRDKLIFPDSLFFQTDTLDFSSLYNDKKKNRVAVKGLFDIFNEYKFTIDENTPIEQEIALDPELLGQTLENLLASYNPETKATARKSTGSYYTPREIVDYMVDESLIAYLSQYLKDNDETLKDMDSLDELLRDTFAYTEKSHPFSEQEVETIIDAVFKLKMLDPACGSGAFPMGILLKMVYVLKRIDPENKIWKKKLIKTIPEEMKPYIEINTDNFSRKLGLIWNSIYGVDIQTIAIQLTKLRFFISLIAEEKVDWNNEDNFGILPLPNLETKFVAANTLIGIERPKTSQSDWLENELKQKENELKHNRLEYFNANSRREKNRIKIKDKKLRLELADELENYGFKHEITNKIAAWEPYNINHAADWFDPEYMFMVTGGFDIVIGNPPYIQLQKFSGQQIQKDYEAQKFESFAKTGDIYELFYEKGNMLLKENGILAFITSNKWMRANYGKKLRKYFAENTQPIQLIDFGGYRVFESATVDTNILIFKNSPLQRGGSEAENSTNSPLAEGWHEVTGCSACTIRKGFTRETDIAKYLKQNGIELSNLSEESWIISTKEEFAIKQKIEKIGTPLKDWDINIYRGVLTGFNEAFIISGEKKDELIAKDPKSAEIIKPILRGRDIKRYKAEFADLWLIATHNGYHKFPSFRGVARSDGVFKNNKKENIPRINIEDYPAIKEHLDKYWDKISVRYDKGDTPYNLRNCAYYEEFEKEKIVYPDIAEKLTFVLDSNNFFINNTCYFINTIKSNKYVLSVLSSNLMNWYFRNISSQLGKKGLRHFNIYIEKIPLPKITPENQKPFEILVDQILQRKETPRQTSSATPLQEGKETPRQTSSATPLQEGNTTHLENQIDLMVYKLYELTYEEIKIVDEDFDTVLAELGLDKEDFENKSLQDLAEFFGVNEKVTESEIEENTKIVAVEEQSAEPIIEVPEPKEIIQEKIEPTKKVQYQFEVGQSVKHKTFGVGIIKNVKGSGENTTVIVKFGKESKKLMARYAKLEIV